MLQPKRTKFRKMHKGRNRGLAQGTDVHIQCPCLSVILHVRSKQHVVL